MKTTDLKELARQERNRYYREYRASHPEKVREANRKYWEKRAARMAAEREAMNNENAND